MAPPPPWIPAPRVKWLIHPGVGAKFPGTSGEDGWKKFWSCSPRLAETSGVFHPFNRIYGYYPEDKASHFAVTTLEISALKIWRRSVKQCLQHHSDNINIGGELAKEIVEELCAPQQFHHLGDIFQIDKMMIVESGHSFSTVGEFLARSSLRAIGDILKKHGSVHTLQYIERMIFKSVAALVEARLQERPEERVISRRGHVDWSTLGYCEDDEDMVQQSVVLLPPLFLNEKSTIVPYSTVMGFPAQHIEDSELGTQSCQVSPEPSRKVGRDIGPGLKEALVVRQVRRVYDLGMD
ncbi:hypothetical protein TWF481_008709 [Arthrobotrys musiformis]|uniref:Uncharacterized protein n=1 Tax=Arthrobotrys musiformis TaxID=47236 RepID=A0AAV9W8Y3_9PEZI